jgi:DUF971 family protein
VIASQRPRLYPQEISLAGRYAVNIRWSDGHDTGIYSWDYLYDLGARHDELWARYIARLEQAGASRDPGATPAAAPAAQGCGHRH